MTLEIWDVWYPRAAATGIPVARGRLDAAASLLVHAVPDYITVEVRDDAGNRVAYGKDLPRTLESPMCLLTRDSDRVLREDLWPDESHIGLPVLLPGGEVGILKSWWNAGDRKEWRWQIELYNSLRA
jgi:hypothetical protein